MKSTSILAAVFILSLLIGSCSKDDTETPQEPLGAYEGGILVSNEGPFGNGTGTVTFISSDLNITEMERIWETLFSPSALTGTMLI